MTYKLLVLGIILTVQLQASPTIIDDDIIYKKTVAGVGAAVDAKQMPPWKTLRSQLLRKTCSLKLPQPSPEKPSNIYKACVDSVVAITSVYKCDHCDKWHNTGIATAWVLTEDGVMVTNYHVIADEHIAGIGIRTRDGKIAPVIEILAADQKNDIAIFRVKGKGFHPLPLGADAEVGSPVYLISHPDNRFFTFTSGLVSRYSKQHQRKFFRPIFMAVTLDFARGSSGGPILNSHGHVVGMVASTENIYYPAASKSKGGEPLQMLINNCVPILSIRALITPLSPPVSLDKTN